MKWYWVLGIIILSLLVGYLLYWWSTRNNNGNGKDENGKDKIKVEKPGDVLVVAPGSPSSPVAFDEGGGGGPVAAVNAV